MYRWRMLKMKSKVRLARRPFYFHCLDLFAMKLQSVFAFAISCLAFGVSVDALKAPPTSLQIGMYDQTLQHRLSFVLGPQLSVIRNQEANSRRRMYYTNKDRVSDSVCGVGACGTVPVDSWLMSNPPAQRQSVDALHWHLLRIWRKV